MFDTFQTSFDTNTSRKDYELPDKILQQKFFKLNGSSTNTVVSCLIEEVEGLREFHGQNQTVAFNDKDTIIGLLRHCILHDLVAELTLKNKQCQN